ncbi:MAG: T9SS C-terminal target domain-containing protein [Calditrichaeota bacterium]|nr:MAG: T9SS C-terminal target domain-containing protein [Calditrichota bacterium]
MKKPLILSILIVILLMAGSTVQAQCIESYIIDSLAEESSFEYEITYAGDVNNDGYDDFLICSEGADNSNGAIYVHSGRTGLILYTISGRDFTGWGFGALARGVGDINGDNHDDFVIADLMQNYDAGLFSGADGSQLMTLPRCDAIDAAGDVNNDGVNDILLGYSRAECNNPGTNQAGRVVVVSGADGSYLHELWGICGDITFFGQTVAGMGDLNEDGYDDFAIGIPRKDVYLNGWFYEHGEVMAISGADGDTLHLWHAGMDVYDNYRFGNDIDNVGDVDGDGINDIIIGHADQGNSLSRDDSCWVFSGVYDSTQIMNKEPLYTLRNNTSNLRFGMSVSAAGDVNLDGTPDMAVADSTHQYNRIHIYSGVDGSMLQTISGPQSNYTGDRLDFAGDINGDGKGDLLSGWEKYLPYDPDTIIFHVYTCIFEEPECEADIDTDSDGYGDLCDNCPTNANSDQVDTDHDGIGDACDDCTDSDWDGYGDVGFPLNTTCIGEDNCSNFPNPGQEDEDVDGVGDACDGCPSTYNPDQQDIDLDRIPDACDNCPDNDNEAQLDDDSDGIGNQCDNCRYDVNPNQENSDGDNYGDLCDNCPDIANDYQQDLDGDGSGSHCDDCEDPDGDGFGWGYAAETCPTDNCHNIYNPNQEDLDSDGIGDSCDICPSVYNPDQEDWNYDGIGDSCVNMVTTPTGTDVVVDGGSGVTVTIPEVNNQTSLEVVTTDGDDPPANGAFTILPGGATVYHIDILQSWYTTPPYTICIDYDDTGMDADMESMVALWHNVVYWDTANFVYDTAWFDVTTTLDTVSNIVCGETDSFSPFTVGIGTSPVSVEELISPEIPESFTLSQNYPNPFNPETAIEYSIPARANVSIEVFNVLGQKVKTLVDKNHAAGVYRIVWDGMNKSGKKVSSGVYLYKLTTDDFSETKTMILLK